ncbi:LacI family transcriptional regulator [Nocardioides sp. TRM66260-LWL]|uniref:LacI family DNA-binding transcriptional regulator n=1 Tax=Nocardioides sp. TRM66260-LWL TaxID=2874478 RepID=UPI001CC78414|nr:LacI family DNA-binding transcriptional regulator [Nocardioides sp. TRM66260-LWL]MBZ5735470.1 LacI family transcriptional regulator [Nocardioides sp. TRM66260-LWL]
MTRPPTLQDVAARARVSHQTVSRVVNGSGNVRPATEERVRAAIEELGYRQNLSARALAAGRSGLIGAVMFGSGQFGPQQILLSVDRAARAAGYRLATRTAHELVEDEVRACVGELLGYGVEAVVLIAAHDSALRVQSAELGVPVLVLAGDDPDRRPAGPSVGMDNRGGAREATRHLLGLGHGDVAHLAGPPGWSETVQRVLGWQDARAEAGLPPAEPLVAGDWSAASGHLAASLVEPGTTAVFAANDQMAMGLVAGLEGRGRRVPRDVSVVGFDDLPEAPYLRPALTTVRQDFAALGAEALAVLARLLHGEDAGPTALVPCPLQVRASTAPPPA